jgi:hypothetical protein
LEHYLNYIDENGLFAIKAWNFVDWAPIDQPNDGIVTHQNLFLVRALNQASRLGVLAQDERAARYAEAAGKLKDAVNRHLWCEERQAYRDCIHADGRLSDTFSFQSQIIAYSCGVPEGERKRLIERYLTGIPADFVKSGSPFISFFHYEGLVEIGQFEWMLNDIRRNYGQMIEHEASACWEMYPEHSETEDRPKRLTRSHCHAWSAAPCYFLGAYVLGVRSAAPGWKEVIVAPNPGGLLWARGSVPLNGNGRIDVSWKADEASRTLSIEVRAPRDVNVEIKIPDGYKGNVKQTVI